ncbi:uncharacterized protein LOC112885132 [Panicum hallii]|uniref:uncharacterized protein LOC112885132 n=1 Tax=Panicum hallii TaxID=206008 RepID=UPI000DF4CD5E|nr:uncharacterized protein LOC112885132 [Panicum hallii]
MRRETFSRHDGFFASLQRVEGRLASEKHQERKQVTRLRDGDTGGCDCSGADGFLAKVVGVAGPKCDGEKWRLDAWIRHYCHRGEGGGCRVREPARLAHLLLARASSDAAAVASPATVENFLDRDPKCRSGSFAIYPLIRIAINSRDPK